MDDQNITKKYFVYYTYKCSYGNNLFLSDEHYCDSREEAEEYIEQIKNKRELTSLTLITHEKLI